jgi:hypothetical protein
MELPQRLGQDLRGRLDAVAARGGEEVGLQHVGEMFRIIVKLTDDEISLCEQFALKSEVLGMGNDHAVLEARFLLSPQTECWSL